MNLTPEQCFDRAMKLLERGKIDKAISLLQIATLRAPGEGRYREALQAARKLKQEAAPEAEPASAGTSLADASAEDIYQQAMALQQEGDSAHAARLLQIAVAKAPGETRYRETLESLCRPEPEEKLADKPIDRALKRLDEEVASAPRPRAAPGGRSPILLLGVLAALLLAVGGLWFAQQPDRISAEAFQGQLPVTSAITPGNRELIVQIDDAGWATMAREERESRLRGVMAEASTQGFEAVYVHSQQDLLLGSVRGATTFLPR